jgi:hypothetical protein
MFAEMPLDNRTVNKSAALFALGRHFRPYPALWNCTAFDTT